MEVLYGQKIGMSQTFTLWKKKGLWDKSKRAQNNRAGLREEEKYVR